MNKNFSALFLFIITMSGFQSNAQTKHWVKFKNKNGTPYTLSNPAAYLTNKAIQRRTTYSISIDSTDLPVTPSYINQVENVPNTTVLFVSKWLNGAVVQISNASALTAINSLSFVAGTNAVNRFKVVIPEMEQSPSSAFRETAVSSATFNYGGARWQNNQIGVDCIHSQGYRGQGMTIAVLDAGFQNVNTNPVFDSVRNRGGILGTRDFVTGGTSVYEDDSHGAMVFSCMAALKPGTIIGSAPRANYWLLRTEDVGSETPSEEYNWIRGVEFSDSMGVDVVTTSLGYTTFDNNAQSHTYSQLNGKTINMSKVATMAARKGILVLNSAGNEGAGTWYYISAPADADSICTVGAVDSLASPASFSSNGPTADGRIKPDLVAGGYNAWVTYPGGFSGTANGTSFSCPILAGAMACYWQKHPQFNNIKVIDTLKKTASLALNPNNKKGWGVPNMCNIIAGIKKTDSDLSDIEIYPVPCRDKLTIFSGVHVGILTIEITDVQGKILKSIAAENRSPEKAIDVSTLAPGLYILKLKSSSSTSIRKFIKE